MSEQQKRYASMASPFIAAMVSGLYRLPTKEAAYQKRDHALNGIILSKRKHDERSLVVWIKGYALTEQEKEEGYLGHYAAVKVARVERKWTLQAEKLEVPLKEHPQRKYMRSAHPNWGYPALRRIRKQKPYDTVEDAQAELAALHQAFPKSSILPSENKLYLMIYGQPIQPTDITQRESFEHLKESSAKGPLHKYVFVLKASEEGGCVIQFRLNTSERKKPLLTSTTDDDDKPTPPQEPVGRFTSMVKKQRR